MRSVVVEKDGNSLPSVAADVLSFLEAIRYYKVKFIARFAKDVL